MHRPLPGSFLNPARLLDSVTYAKAIYHSSSAAAYCHHLPARNEFITRNPTIANQTQQTPTSTSFECSRLSSFRVAMSATNSTPIMAIKVVRTTATTWCRNPISVLLIPNVSTPKADEMDSHGGAESVADDRVRVASFHVGSLLTIWRFNHSLTSMNVLPFQRNRSRFHWGCLQRWSFGSVRIGTSIIRVSPVACAFSAGQFPVQVSSEAGDVHTSTGLGFFS